MFLKTDEIVRSPAPHKVAENRWMGGWHTVYHVNKILQNDFTHILSSQLFYMSLYYSCALFSNVFAWLTDANKVVVLKDTHSIGYIKGTLSALQTEFFSHFPKSWLYNWHESLPSSCRQIRLLTGNTGETVTGIEAFLTDLLDRNKSVQISASWSAFQSRRLNNEKIALGFELHTQIKPKLKWHYARAVNSRVIYPAYAVLS